MTYSKNNTAKIRCAFLLGEINDIKLTADASKESGACRFKDIELSIMILTINRNKKRKSVIYTWVTYSKNKTANIRCAFHLGEINDTKLTADASKESDA